MTFFSALAEWRHDPRPVFVAGIDNTDHEELFELIVTVDAGSTSAIALLVERLEEKIQQTNSLNIDYHGLQQMLFLVKGIIRHRENNSFSSNESPVSRAFRDLLDEAVLNLKQAVEDSVHRSGLVALANRRLQEIVDELKTGFLT